MAVYPHTCDVLTSHDRDGHDGGRAARASRYFSAKTMRDALGYRDISWRRLALQFLVSLPFMSAPMIQALGDFGVLAMLAGAGLAGVTAYIGLAKLLDATRRR